MTDHAMPVSVAVDGDVFAAHLDYVALIMLAQGIGNGPSDDASSACSTQPSSISSRAG